jgi:tRNA(adenine34) deaminase
VKQPAASDEFFMHQAIREALNAERSGEVPIGAVVVHCGKVIGRGQNRVITDNDASAHAEIVALREAGRALGNYRLAESEMYVTIEPCPMCAGALVHARIARLVYGADDPKAGAVRSVMQVINAPGLNHQMAVIPGVLAGRCAELLQSFFREKRG